MLDALTRRAEYYAELDAMTPEQRAEHDAGIAELKAMLSPRGEGAPLLDFDGKNTDSRPRGNEPVSESYKLNSPVTPDGWIPVS